MNKPPKKHHITPSASEASNRFLIDAINLFTGDRSGHMSPYAFAHAKYKGDPANGTEYWTKFIQQSKNYYLYDEERELIEKYSDRIVSHLPDDVSFIELGPGELRAVREKSIELLDEFNKSSGVHGNHRQITEYIALDISSQFATTAAKEVGHRFGIVSSAAVSDFNADHLTIDTWSKPVMLVFGGTLFNAPNVKFLNTEYILKSYLDNIKDIVGPGGYVVLSQDTNNDYQSLMKAYDHKMSNAASLSIMHRIERDLVTENFDGYDFEHAIKWSPDKNLLTLNAVSKVDKVFKIGGISFTINKGDEFPLVNAFKYSTQKFKQIAEDSGFEIIDTIQKKNNGKLALHVMRVKPPSSLQP
jgi:uncharacterized SAM-dependent methyltransferase